MQNYIFYRVSVYCCSFEAGIYREDNVIKLHVLILINWCFKIREIAKTLHISKERLIHIVYEILNIKKLLIWSWRCLVCSLRIISLHNSVQYIQPLLLFRRSFCIASWPSLKYWFTDSQQRSRNSWNSEFQSANQLRRQRKLTYWLVAGVDHCFLRFTRCDLHRQILRTD